MFWSSKETEQRAPNKKIKCCILSHEGYRSNLISNCFCEKDNKKVEIKLTNFLKAESAFIFNTNANNITIKKKLKRPVIEQINYLFQFLKLEAPLKQLRF
jgi:hypothetical protein